MLFELEKKLLQDELSDYHEKIATLQHQENSDDFNSLKIATFEQFIQTIEEQLSAIEKGFDPRTVILRYLIKRLMTQVEDKKVEIEQFKSDSSPMAPLKETILTADLTSLNSQLNQAENQLARLMK